MAQHPWRRCVQPKDCGLGDGRASENKIGACPVLNSATYDNAMCESYLAHLECDLGAWAALHGLRNFRLRLLVYETSPGFKALAKTASKSAAHQATRPR